MTYYDQLGLQDNLLEQASVSHLSQQQRDSPPLFSLPDSLTEELLHLAGVGGHNHLHPLLPPHLALPHTHKPQDQHQCYGPHLSPLLTLLVNKRDLSMCTSLFTGETARSASEGHLGVQQ